MSRYYDYGNAISWNNQALPSGSVGPGSGSQGKDPLAPALPGRSLYQHATVSGRGRTPSTLAACTTGTALARRARLAPMPSPSPTAPLAPFPVHPDVKFRKLPFYDVLAELMKPSTMMPMQAGRMQEGTYVFHLTPQQATEIASGKDLVGTSNKLDYVIQAQLRFCLLETSCEQEDHFPPSVNVKVNNKMCPLPNPIPTNKPTPEPKRPPRPVNISSLVKLSPTVANTIQVTWAADFTRAYVLSVFMVRKLTSAELLQRLKNKGTKNPDYTRSLIKEKLSEDYDSEIATTSLRVSLMCPLGKMRMACPCRPANCPHLQCFDASLFLQMNERKPTWLCPVCDRPAPYDSLVVDGATRSQLHADGSWSAHAPPARAPQLQQPTAEPVTLISDDLEVIPVDSGVGAAKRAAVGEARAPRSADVMVDLTSDSDDELPLKRKIPPPKATPPASDVNIKTDDNYSSSAAEAVSSSGYRSPGVAGGACGVISLDSPSPPAPGSPPSSPRDSEPLPERPHLSITPVAPPTSNSSQHHIDLLTKRPQLSVSLVPPPEPASLHLGSSTTVERDDAEATPAHWAPYADSERDDNYRKY
ncbi:hypothetical protein SFRURICE_015127 [Spodoptera frugiperda]|nr:hypothetical protein SFRURICE_015127 [Spodoptera frugiperda]